MLIQKIKVYLIIIFTSLVFTLYLGESYLTFYVKGGKNFWKDIAYKAKIYKKLTGKEYDVRSLPDAYNEMASKHKNSSLALSPENRYKENFFSLSGVSNSKTIHCNENGYYSNYLSDRYGFNNPDTEWDSKEIDYLIVGDSFAHGACVNRPHDFSSVLRILSKKTVINLGIRGNGPLNEYASLREYIPKNVKNIIWFYYENDLIDLSSEIGNKILVKYLKDKDFSQKLITKQNILDSYLKAKITKELIGIKKDLAYWDNYFSTKKIFLRFIRLDKIKSFILTIGKKKSSYNTSKSLKQFKKILILTKSLALESNSNLYFVYLPSYYRYKNNFFSNYNRSSNYDKVVKIVNDLDIPLLDMNKDFFLKQKNPTEYFPYGKYGHYTIEGYSKLTSLIYQFTKKI